MGQRVCSLLVLSPCQFNLVWSLAPHMVSHPLLGWCLIKDRGENPSTTRCEPHVLPWNSNFESIHMEKTISTYFQDNQNVCGHIQTSQVSISRPVQNPSKFCSNRNISRLLTLETTREMSVCSGTSFTQTSFKGEVKCTFQSWKMFVTSLRWKAFIVAMIELEPFNNSPNIQIKTILKRFVWGWGVTGKSQDTREKWRRHSSSSHSSVVTLPPWDTRILLVENLFLPQLKEISFKEV